MRSRKISSEKIHIYANGILKADKPDYSDIDKKIATYCKELGIGEPF